MLVLRFLGRVSPPTEASPCICGCSACLLCFISERRILSSFLSCVDCQTSADSLRPTSCLSDISHLVEEKVNVFCVFLYFNVDTDSTQSWEAYQELNMSQNSERQHGREQKRLGRSGTKTRALLPSEVHREQRPVDKSSKSLVHVTIIVT